MNGRSYKMRNKNFKEEKGTFERRKRYICEKERVHLKREKGTFERRKRVHF